MARRKKLPTEPFEAEITTLLENGRGACMHDGRSLEVHGGLAGERVRARYLFGRRLRGQAEVLEVLTASDDRVAPRCPHFGTCSACTLQHMDPEAQIHFKHKNLLDHFQAQGVIPSDILPPLQAGSWHYRRKARLSVRHVRGKGRVLVGFRERDGRFVADIEECHILPQSVAERLEDLSRLVGSLDTYENIPQIEVTCGDDTCALVFRHLEPLPEDDLERLRQFVRKTGLAVLLQPGGPESVAALEPAKPGLSYTLPEFGLEYRFEPLDFVQVNGALNRLMVAQALELLAPGTDDHVLDLFCGLGNFTLPLARYSGHVVGVEGDSGLVERARENARRNGVTNVEFRQSDLYSGTVQDWPDGAFDRVLLDPPRSGAAEILPLIASTTAKRVLYVSCNSETLARDAASLNGQHGYELRAAGVMDMFPHTAHFESMALFGRD